jgi:hypothetical protein
VHSSSRPASDEQRRESFLDYFALKSRAFRRFYNPHWGMIVYGEQTNA